MSSEPCRSTDSRGTSYPMRRASRRATCTSKTCSTLRRRDSNCRCRRSASGGWRPCSPTATWRTLWPRCAGRVCTSLASSTERARPRECCSSRTSSRSWSAKCRTPPGAPESGAPESGAPESGAPESGAPAGAKILRRPVVDLGAQLVRRSQGEVWIAQELTGDHHRIRLTALDDLGGVLRCRDQPHRAHLHLGGRADVRCERNLVSGLEWDAD